MLVDVVVAGLGGDVHRRGSPALAVGDPVKASALRERWATTCARVHPGSTDGSRAPASSRTVGAVQIACGDRSVSSRSGKGEDVPPTHPTGPRAALHHPAIMANICSNAPAPPGKEVPWLTSSSSEVPASTTSRTSRSSCPRDSLIVFTGLSGSGKSSLAFDTIFAEGQRRYVESLSAYARQFLGQMDKPDVDFIEGLSPAVSIDQKSTSKNPRSTVGTITEVYDYLRLLYARAGRPHCPTCGAPISRQTPQQIVDRILTLEEGAALPGAGPGDPRPQGRVRRALPPAADPGLLPGPRQRRDPPARPTRRSSTSRRSTPSRSSSTGWRSRRPPSGG